MESDKQHFRHILLFYYRKGKNAVQVRKKLTDVYGKGRPVEADKDAIKALVDANRRITTREIGLRLNLSNSTVYDYLKGLGLSSKLDAWVPHVFREICVAALTSAIRFSNLLPDNTTINSEVYCHQLDKLNDALQQKRSEVINRKGVVFHQDNARPHTSLVTRQKLLQLEWDTMPHPPYSPDLAPSDYYLFRSLQNFLDARPVQRCPLLEECFPNGEPYIFMQDGAPCHTARSIKAFLAVQNIPLLDWPCNSPDMNPIENVWELMKREVAKDVITNKTQLLERIIHMWNHHPQMQETVQSCIDSMPRRIEALIAAKGGSTKY
ncbi:histone-lysine N-methyltransferase SETMAR [Trichonephila clavipes]|nr:histone-lysine N-methyltransferase SETMAR [Trichonephila clavipes]